MGAASSSLLGGSGEAGFWRPASLCRGMHWAAEPGCCCSQAVQLPTHCLPGSSQGGPHCRQLALERGSEGNSLAALLAAAPACSPPCPLVASWRCVGGRSGRCGGVGGWGQAGSAKRAPVRDTGGAGARCRVRALPPSLAGQALRAHPPPTPCLPCALGAKRLVCPGSRARTGYLAPCEHAATRSTSPPRLCLSAHSALLAHAANQRTG